MMEAFYGDSKKQKKGERKKPTYRNKNSMLLISCHHDQKFPFPPFPLKATLCLISLAQSGKPVVGFCLREVHLCSCKEGSRYFIVSVETLLKTRKNLNS